MSSLIFPYLVMQGDLELHITGTRLDGGDFPKDPLLPDRRTLQLYDIDKQNWARVQLTLELTGSSDEIAKFDAQGCDLHAVVVAHCAETNHRQGVWLKRSAESEAANRWTGTIELERDNFSGKAELTPTVTGIVDGADAKIMGSANPWSIHFDEADTTQIDGTLRVRWVDFENPKDDQMLLDYMDHSFVTDLAGSRPTLFLNKSDKFRGLQALLGDRKRTSPWDRALHDAERVGIARSVWMAMVNASIAAIRKGEEGEEPDWPVTEWKKQVLKAVLTRVYPDMSEKTALAAANEAWQSGEGASMLESACEAEIGSLIGASKLLKRSLQYLSANMPTDDAVDPSTR